MPPSLCPADTTAARTVAAASSAHANLRPTHFVNQHPLVERIIPPPLDVRRREECNHHANKSWHSSIHEVLLIQSVRRKRQFCPKSWLCGSAHVRGWTDTVCLARLATKSAAFSRRPDVAQSLSWREKSGARAEVHPESGPRHARRAPV